MEQDAIDVLLSSFRTEDNKFTISITDSAAMVDKRAYSGPIAIDKKHIAEAAE
jgi:hypothetical protein